MKSNVDLSSEGMFTKHEWPTGLAKIILDCLKVTKPWDFENNPVKVANSLDDKSLYRSNSLFPTGNKKDRNIWKLQRLYDTDKICDSCGKIRGKKPWAKARCNCYSSTYAPPIPWKF